MKTKITLFIIGILALGVLTGKAATILQGNGGGTGKGSATSTDVGKFLRVSSTTPRLIYDFGDAGGDSFWSRTGSYLYPSTSTDFVGIGTSTPATPLYVVGTSTIDGNILTRGIYNLADGVLYFDLANQTIRDSSALGAINHTSRLLLDSSEASSIDWSTASALIFPAYSTDGLLKTSGSNGTVANAADGTDYWSPTTLTNNNQLTNGAGYVTADGVVTSIVAGTNITVSSATGTVTVAATTTPSFTRVGLSDSNSLKYGERSCAGSFMFSYATSTTNWYDDILLGVTSTITRVVTKNYSSSDSLSWNLYYNNTIAEATTTGAYRVFSSDQVSNTTTTVSAVPTASSTPDGNMFLRLRVYNASSSEFSINPMCKDR